MSEISDFVARYIAARDNSAQYCNNLRKRSTRLSKFIGSSDLAELFHEAKINEFLASLTDLSPRTVRSYRSDLLALWNAAADEDLVEYPRMRRIRRPKCPALIIDCYTVDEARAILAQARMCHPYVMRNGVNRRDYWPAVIQLAWDTGLRRGDVWAFRKSWIRPDRSARVVQRKTQKVVTVQLHESTIEALDRIPFDQATRWPGCKGNDNRFCAQFKAMVVASGVNRGTFKWLRRSSGSYCEMLQAGSGSKQLGHSSQQIFNQHYDARLGGHTGPMPPTIG